MLEAGRPVVVAGDLNIAPYPIDHCDFLRAPAHIQATMLTDRPDRAWFRRMLHQEGGPLVDLFRYAAHINSKAKTCVWRRLIVTSWLIVCTTAIISLPLVVPEHARSDSMGMRVYPAQHVH